MSDRWRFEFGFLNNLLWNEQQTNTSLEADALSLCHSQIWSCICPAIIFTVKKKKEGGLRVEEPF